MSNGFAEFLHWWQKTAETPTPYGWFHLLMIGITIGITVLMYVFFRGAKEKTYRRIILIVGIVLILLETFNMFFISPFFECTLPLLDGIYKAVPYPLFLLLYIVPFFLICVILYFTQFGIYRLSVFLKNKFSNKKEIVET